MKLHSKTRVEGKIHRQYEPALTPCQRLLNSDQLTRKAKKELQQQYESLNVAELRRKIDELKDRLFRMVESKPGSDGIKLRRKGVGISIQRWNAKPGSAPVADRTIRKPGKSGQKRGTAAMMAGIAGHVWGFDELFKTVLGA